jgi:hypothetical protein
VVFRWLCQMRVAPYSYDLIDNLGRRSPQELTPGLERLERGQWMAVVFRLEDFEPGRCLVLRHRGPVFGTVVCVYVVEPRGPAAARLLVRVRVDRPPGPVRGLAHRLLPFGDLVMMRRQLLNFKGWPSATRRAPRWPEWPDGSSCAAHPARRARARRRGARMSLEPSAPSASSPRIPWDA